MKKIEKSISLPLLTVLLAALVTLSPFAIDSYLAAMPLMATFFGVHIGIIELTITVYFLGFAIGNFFGGPLSDAYGRKPIALLGIFLYGLSAIIIPFCTDIEWVLFFRITQAFGGGFATVTANLFIRDWFTGKQVAKYVTIISMMMMLAPLFAPVIGSFLIAWKGWQAVFYFITALAILLFVVFLLLIPESREASLISKKITAKQLLDKYRLFFSDRHSVLLLFTVSFSMAGLYLFITSASFIYLDYFEMDRKVFPLFFGANVLLNILLALLNTFMLKYYEPKRLLKVGMFMQLFGGLSLLIAVLMPNPSFGVVFGSIVLFIGSLGLVFGNGTAVILNHNPQVSGSANATLGIMRFLLSFVLGSLIALFHTGNLLPIGITMFFCTLVANILYKVAFYKNKS